MTYDEYTVKVRARMKKLVRAENAIKKYRFLIIAIADILFIAFIFTMYFAGSFMKDLSVHDAVYGENAVAEASAFLSRVKYIYKEMLAPIIVAMGTGLIAQKIKEIAKENDVPIVENKPLAREMFKKANVGDEIPPELFEAVAEIIGQVMTKQNRKAA